MWFYAVQTFENQSEYNLDMPKMDLDWQCEQGLYFLHCVQWEETNLTVLILSMGRVIEVR